MQANLSKGKFPKRPKFYMLDVPCRLSVPTLLCVKEPDVFSSECINR